MSEHSHSDYSTHHHHESSHDRHRSSSHHSDRHDSHKEYKEYRRNSCISYYSNKVNMPKNPNTMLEMAKELRDLRQLLQTWKRNRKAKLNGEEVSPFYIQLVDHHVENTEPTELTHVPSYHNSHILNKFLNNLGKTEETHEVDVNKE